MQARLNLFGICSIFPFAMGPEERPGRGNLQEGEIKNPSLEVYSWSLHNLRGRPNEDFKIIGKKFPIFAVADGVSRTKKPGERYSFRWSAHQAAVEFCVGVMDTIEAEFHHKRGLKVLERAFSIANIYIRSHNISRIPPDKIDFLANDYYCACGVAAFIKEGLFYYGYLGDCGIRIYDQNDRLRYYSVDDVKPIEEHRDGLPYESSNQKILEWRRDYRNHPKADYSTYGVFTGEEEALYYCHFGKIQLKPGDLIFLYSDGFLHFIKKSDFRALFRRVDLKDHHPKNAVKRFVAAEIEKHPSRKTSEELGDDKTLIAILVK